jgi:hypothetical protein
MALRCEGMEFASEIVVKASRANLRVAEVPIVYHPRIGESKLNSLRDGWRHLRFLLLLSPIYLFLIPGVAMLTVGVVGESIDLAIGTGAASTNLSILSALLAVTGVMTIIFGVFTQTFLQGLGFQNPNRVSNWLDHSFSLERSLIVAMTAIGTGLVIDVMIWAAGKSNELGGAKWSVASIMLVAIGVVILFGSFFLSIFRVRIHGTDKLARSEDC